MSTSQSSVWKDKEANEQAQYVNARQEEQQIESLRAQSDSEVNSKAQAEPLPPVPRGDRDYEAGFGGQEDLEDRYATTSGEH
ncbi:hypothetical protein BJV78DRAFT_1367520 [Lactifluus subvellereus]|nr:hypothetical protein BJV78DRAFT_1367520 [Lactifluus subvellereus]